jgi:hypothetical protein
MSLGSEEPTRSLVIDAHAHMGPAFKSHPPLFPGVRAADIVDLMDSAGIHMACVFAPQAVGAEFFDPTYRRANRAVFRGTEAYPTRLIGVARVDPNRGRVTLDEMRRCHDDYGFRGLKLHPLWEHFHPDDLALMAPIMEACEAYRWPIFCHTGHPPVCQPSLFVPLAKQFPNVDIILFHLSYAHVDDAIAAARLCSNIYLETAGNSPASFIKEVYARLPATKLLYGSDLPYHQPAEVLAKIVNQPDIDAADRALVLGGNIARLLEL